MHCRRVVNVFIQIALAAVALGTPSARVLAQASDSTQVRRVSIVPGAKYDKGWLHRFILGDDYRDLWATEIQVEVLDLRRTAGGLEPTQRGGSMQTNSLRFAAGNGREYVFRPLEKDFTKGLPEELRQTLVRDIAQDQVAGYHPAAPLVVSDLLDATGLRHPRPVLRVMPDDSLLGEFRAEFAGVLGTFEERPGEDFDEAPGASGATNVISSERLFERRRNNHENVVNAPAYLAARLFDILVGDRDRHRDQWRWGRFSNARNALWEPIPRDRDMPFARFEGLGPWVIRGFVPQMITFTDRYPDMVWLNWNAREIDRRLLVGLDRAAWDSVVSALQRQLSDSVLDESIRAMPAPFVERDGPRLREALRRRRARLPEAARDFYAILSREVNLEATDDPDVADITRESDGSVRVALSARASAAARRDGAPERTTYLTRRFVPGETREVRIFLHGGNDSVRLRGVRNEAILVRIVGDSGDDVVVDSVAGGDAALAIYDAEGTNAVVGTGNHEIDSRRYVPPATDRAERAVRDWGRWSFTQRLASYSPNLGAVAGLSHTRFDYGFRADPYRSRQTARVDFSFGERRPRLSYDGEFRPPNSKNYFELALLASGLELIRFHGLGNETPSDSGTSFYRVFQNLYRIEPRWVMRAGRGANVSFGVAAQFSSTRDDASTLVGATEPYGSDEFGQVAAKLDLSIDRRDSPVFPTKGVHMVAGGSLVPALWSVERTFGETHATAATYLSARGTLAPTLALRAGGQHVFGDFPFHEAAFLGGASTLRGWDQQRFAGRSVVYGSAELRMRLGKIRVIVPADVGVLGFSDVGRVFLDDEESDRWHTGNGGGLWIAPLMRNYTVSVSLAQGRERTGVYLRSGFAF